MTNFYERTNRLLYKNIPLTLYSRKGWCWLCVRGELETGTDCYILTQSSSDHSNTSFSSWLGCSTVGHWGPKILCLPLALHSGILSPTHSNCNWNWLTDWLKPSVAPGYIFVWHPHASCGRTHLPPSTNSTTCTGQRDIFRYLRPDAPISPFFRLFTRASLDWRLGRGSIYNNNSKLLKSVEHFVYLGSNISSLESDVNIRRDKVRTAMDRLTTLWKSDISDEIKREFFQEVAVSVLLRGCTTWTLIKQLGEKLDENYAWMLHAVLHESLTKYVTK